jgi:hypothetical protein
MLPDLRPLIADSMVELANHFDTDPTIWASHLDGAQTLRWCAEYEAAPSVQELAELDTLRQLLDAIDDALSGTSKHPGTQVKAIKAAAAELGISL